MPRTPSEHGLGRVQPLDFVHVDKYPFKTVAPSTVMTVERVLALPSWHWSHDQGREGSCVGHGCAMERAITNSTQNKILRALRLYTRRYDPLDLWNEAKLIDEFPETQPGDDNGTTVRAGYDVLRDRGPRRIALGGIKLNASGDPVVDDQHERAPDIDEGVIRTRWATTVDEIRTAIAEGIPVVIGVDWFSNFDDPISFGVDKWIGRAGWQNTGVRGGHCVCLYGASDKRQAFKMKNSWGRSYPLVWLTYNAMGGLLGRNGEAALTTDR
jgi:hypothetical protein